MPQLVYLLFRILCIIELINPQRCGKGSFRVNDFRLGLNDCCGSFQQQRGIVYYNDTHLSIEDIMVITKTHT